MWINIHHLCVTQGSIWHRGRRVLTPAEKIMTLGHTAKFHHVSSFPYHFNFPTPADKISQIEPWCNHNL